MQTRRYENAKSYLSDLIKNHIGESGIPKGLRTDFKNGFKISNGKGKQNQWNDAQESGKSQNKQKKISYYFDFSEVLNYFFRKNDPNKKSNFSLKAMHTVNKLSILMFLIGVMVVIVRRIFS